MAVVASSVLREAGVVFVFVYTFLSEDQTWMLPLTLYALTLHMFATPKKSELNSFLPPESRLP